MPDHVESAMSRVSAISAPVIRKPPQARAITSTRPPRCGSRRPRAEEAVQHPLRPFAAVRTIHLRRGAVTDPGPPRRAATSEPPAFSTRSISNSRPFRLSLRLAVHLHPVSSLD